MGKLVVFFSARYNWPFPTLHFWLWLTGEGRTYSSFPRKILRSRKPRRTTLRFALSTDSPDVTNRRDRSNGIKSTSSWAFHIYDCFSNDESCRHDGHHVALLMLFDWSHHLVASAASRLEVSQIIVARHASGKGLFTHLRLLMKEFLPSLTTGEDADAIYEVTVELHFTRTKVLQQEITKGFNALARKQSQVCGPVFMLVILFVFWLLSSLVCM